MIEFGNFSGLKLNLAKCGLVIKGTPHVDDEAHLESSAAGERFLGILI